MKTSCLKDGSDGRSTLCPSVSTGASLPQGETTLLLPAETWRDIPGYEGKYQASSMGRIRSLGRSIEYHREKPYFAYRSGKMLKCLDRGNTPYYSVDICQKRKLIHRLVAAAFLGPCPAEMEVLHRNGNPKDNRIENLAYDTHSENVRDTYRYGGKQKKLFAEEVEQIRFGLATGISYQELAAMYGVTRSCISRIKTGSRYGWLSPSQVADCLASVSEETKALSLHCSGSFEEDPLPLGSSSIL